MDTQLSVATFTGTELGQEPANIPQEVFNSYLHFIAQQI